MKPIRLIHWNADEAAEKAQKLEGCGMQVGEVRHVREQGKRHEMRVGKLPPRERLRVDRSEQEVLDQCGSGRKGGF